MATIGAAAVNDTKMSGPLPKKRLYGRCRRQPSVDESDPEVTQITDLSGSSEGEGRITPLAPVPIAGGAVPSPGQVRQPSRGAGASTLYRYPDVGGDHPDVGGGHPDVGGGHPDVGGGRLDALDPLTQARLGGGDGVGQPPTASPPTSPPAAPLPPEPSPDWDEEDSLGDEPVPAELAAQLVGRDAPLTCNVCGKEFPIPARLLRHQRIHTGEKPFRCEFCGKTFSVKENLNVHRRIHTKERPYKCEVCGRAFEHSGKLNRHLRIHTGERPHKCNVCAKAFVQSGQLVIHMRAHTGEKPYGCQTCGKAFTCSKQLKVHRRTHTGEKPYTCNICGKSFGYNHVLKTHKNSHYGQRMYKCTICSATFPQRKALEQHLGEHSGAAKLACVSPPSAGVLRRSPSPDRQAASAKRPRPGAFSLTPSYLAAVSSAAALGLPPLAALSGRYTHPAAGFQTPSTGAVVAPHPLRYCYVPAAFPAARTRHDSAGVPSGSSTESRDSPPADGGGSPSPPASLAGSPARGGPDTAHPSYPAHPAHQQRQPPPSAPVDTFTSKVTFILTNLIGAEGLRRLGYPTECGIGEVLKRALLFCSEMPCTDTDVSRLEQLKCNMRTLLLWCIPDQEQWGSYGWKNKTIEEIVDQFYNECSRDAAGLQPVRLAGASASALATSLHVL